MLRLMAMGPEIKSTEYNGKGRLRLWYHRQ